MYVFATIALLGLAVATFVDLVGGTVNVRRPVRPFLAFLAGIGIAWAADLSMFAGFGIALRTPWMGAVATGLVIGGLACAWHELLGALASHSDRLNDQATGNETEIPRAA
jgi:MFS-type transporter involved in bile tolerance (Atg22 family)